MIRRLAPLLCLLASPARAHAILVESTPSPNSHIRPGPLAIALRYNSRIDTGRSKLTLTAPDHGIARLAVTPGDSEAVMRSSATVVPGNYVLRWQVLALDGHITRGNVPFTVDAP